jgi:hypothetical protein
LPKSPLKGKNPPSHYEKYSVDQRYFYLSFLFTVFIFEPNTRWAPNVGDEVEIEGGMKDDK